jgi:aminoglycoside phosphotransferase (APT) family kinase protein
MNAEAAAVHEGLSRLALRLGWGAPAAPRRLSGGASQETWAFEADEQALILRRAPGGRAAPTSTQAIGLMAEAAVIKAAAAAGAPAPNVIAALAVDDGLGEGYVMARVAGETLGPVIQRDQGFAVARARFAGDAGRALARIHATPLISLPRLPEAHAADQLRLYAETFRGYGTHRPIFELGFKALAAMAPPPRPARLVHGDFRLGNLMMQANGIAAVLDWELAHLGDPAEDLGWICTPSWRFRGQDGPVGGLGTIEGLLSGYREAGGDPTITSDHVRFWAMLGTLKWGVMCLTMADVFASGADTSVERAVIGRRASEAELDLILMLQGKL